MVGIFSVPPVVLLLCITALVRPAPLPEILQGIPPRDGLQCSQVCHAQIFRLEASGHTPPNYRFVLLGESISSHYIVCNLDLSVSADCVPGSCNCTLLPKAERARNDQLKLRSKSPDQYHGVFMFCQFQLHAFNRDNRTTHK